MNTLRSLPFFNGVSLQLKQLPDGKLGLCKPIWILNFSLLKLMAMISNLILVKQNLAK
jgi:hypothetical protein